MSIKGSQSISCNVNSCAFNQERKCTLKAIVVATSVLMEIPENQRMKVCVQVIIRG